MAEFSFFMSEASERSQTRQNETDISNTTEKTSLFVSFEEKKKWCVVGRGKKMSAVCLKIYCDGARPKRACASTMFL